MATPVLLSVSPGAGLQGETLTVQVNGQDVNFDDTSTVAVSGAGVTVDSVLLVANVVVRPTLTIDKAAAPGPRDVTVTTGAEVVTGPGLFAVQIDPAVPAVASLSPANGAQGDSFSTQIFGRATNFADGSVVAFSNTGIVASDIVVVSPTLLTATLTIDEAAEAGPSDVTVTTMAGEEEVATGFGAFTVLTSTVKAEILREAVNTYLRQNHVTDPGAVDVCEAFIANINQALRIQVAAGDDAPGIAVSIRPKGGHAPAKRGSKHETPAHKAEAPVQQHKPEPVTHKSEPEPPEHRSELPTQHHKAEPAHHKSEPHVPKAEPAVRSEPVHKADHHNKKS